MDQITTMNKVRAVNPAPCQLFDKRTATINWGTFTGQVESANIIDCEKLYDYKGFIDHREKNNKRLKEWQAFQLSDNEKFICGALYQAKQFAVVAISYYDRISEQHYLYKKFVRPSQLIIADGALPSKSSYEYNGITFSITRDRKAEKTEVMVRWPKQGKLPSLELDLVLEETSAGMTICQPFSNPNKTKENRPLYSYKNLMPARSTLKLDNTIVPMSENSFGILDDHKGFYPKKVNYDWGTAGSYIDNTLVGFNLTRNQIRDPEQFNENCLWYDGSLFALPAIEVTHLEDGWHYKDKYGLVDLMFTKLVNNKQKFHLGFVYMDYQGPFGLYNGYITHPQLGKIAISDMLGMAERKRYKL
jgi:hypothetical protein